MTVTVYTLPGCQPCAATKRHLKKKWITFIEQPMDDYARSVAELQGITAAPLVRIEESPGSSYFWGGYRPDMINALV